MQSFDRCWAKTASSTLEGMTDTFPAGERRLHLVCATAAASDGKGCRSDPRWPLCGRDAELEMLLATLRRTTATRPVSALSSTGSSPVQPGSGSSMTPAAHPTRPVNR